jgi:hypothetical protein
VTPTGISPAKERCSPLNAAIEKQLLCIDTVHAPGFWSWTTGHILAVRYTTSQNDADEMLRGCWREQHHSYLYDEMPRLTKREADILAHRLDVAVRGSETVRNRLDHPLRKPVNREAMEAKGKREAEITREIALSIRTTSSHHHHAPFLSPSLIRKRTTRRSSS